MLKTRALKYVYHRFIWWRLPELAAPDFPIILDYPISPVPRYGGDKPPHPQLHAVIEAGRGRYEARLRQFMAFADELARIPAGPDAPAGEPVWMNQWMSGLDVVALYGFIRELRPRRYLEIGSGNSTKFARRAIQDGGLQTRITSIDPQPRSEIDAICDKVVRRAAEDVDLSEFDQLESGDILFIDSSHRCFMNSDVTVQFLEILPRLKPGVMVHVHDVFLPYDYPMRWNTRYYSEQYLVACYLLGGARFQVEMPNAFVGLDRPLRDIVQPLWSRHEMAGVEEYIHATLSFMGSSFWMRVA